MCNDSLDPVVRLTCYISKLQTTYKIHVVVVEREMNIKLKKNSVEHKERKPLKTSEVKV